MSLKCQDILTDREEDLSEVSSRDTICPTTRIWVEMPTAGIAAVWDIHPTMGIETTTQTTAPTMGLRTIWTDTLSMGLSSTLGVLGAKWSMGLGPLLPPLLFLCIEAKTTLGPQKRCTTGGCRCQGITSPSDQPKGPCQAHSVRVALVISTASTLILCRPPPRSADSQDLDLETSTRLWPPHMHTDLLKDRKCLWLTVNHPSEKTNSKQRDLSLGQRFQKISVTFMKIRCSIKVRNKMLFRELDFQLVLVPIKNGWHKSLSNDLENRHLLQ